MDALKIIFRILLVAIVVYPNFYFFKGLKNSGKYHFKHTLFYFIMSLILPCSIIFIITVIITSPVLIEFLNLDIDTAGYAYRFVVGTIIFPSSIITNIYFGKFYLKRISKTKSEIELIGKE